MIDWTYDGLWQKAKLYAERAIGEDRDGPLFPLWAALALEFIGRATLSKIHPVLLADPREGENIMYAFGYGTMANPKSVPAKTVFIRCKAIVPGFTEEEFKKTMLLIERRNEELHTGNPAFSDYPTKLWLADYFRICKRLLSFQGHSLEELFGTDEAVAAEKMIDAAENRVIKEVKTAIANAADNFGKQDATAQEENRRKGEVEAMRSRGPLGRTISCPACGATARLQGEKITASPLRLDPEGGMVFRDIVVLPTEFRCFSCGLELYGHSPLHAAQLGGHYTVLKTYDPAEFFAYEDEGPDYGND